MSVINASKPSVDENLLLDFFLSGKKITRVKGKRKLPKSLRYNSFTANCKNDAPTFNPMKHAV